MDTVLRTIMVGAAVGCMMGTGCKRHKNPVVDYLHQVEIQYETEAQKENIINGLRDALHLSPEILQGKRYRDYQGNERAWDLRMLFRHHFVPSSKHKVLGVNFFYDITSEEGRKRVAEILETLE